MLRVGKKLRETRFFLRKLDERAQMAFGDHEEFDFYLSALLSAARSVDCRLHYEEGDTYVAFRKSWDNALQGNEQVLIKFMVDDRNVEVHGSGSNRAEYESRIPVFGSYQDKLGEVMVSAPPGCPSAEIIKPAYSFTIGGQQFPVIECCRRYIELLERLLADYCYSRGIA